MTKELGIQFFHHIVPGEYNINFGAVNRLIFQNKTCQRFSFIGTNPASVMCVKHPNSQHDPRYLFPPVIGQNRLGKGKGDALKCGVRQARGDIVVTLDADGETDPEDMPKLIEPLLQGSVLYRGINYRIHSPTQNQPKKPD